jgi:hypothetical protein
MSMHQFFAVFELFLLDNPSIYTRNTGGKVE